MDLWKARRPHLDEVKQGSADTLCGPQQCNSLTNSFWDIGNKAPFKTQAFGFDKEQATF
jgi:hypothetical protein